MQLLDIANFNGLCRVIAALAHNGLIRPWQIENIHDCMTAPLDDPDWRDYEFIANTRDVVENVLSCALKEAKAGGGGGLELDDE
jgi:hypothetical protein